MKAQRNDKPAEFDKLIRELKECARGKRPTVEISKKRATKIGIAHSNLIVAAKSLGLRVGSNGGYYAQRSESESLRRFAGALGQLFLLRLAAHVARDRV